MSSTNSHDRFLYLLKPVHDRLARYALVVTKNREDAEDLINDTLLAAFEQFDKLKEPDKFLHLLLRIASRLWMRRRQRSQRFIGLSDDHTNLSISNGTAEANAELRLVMDALDTFPQKLKETIVLFDVLDLSHEEIRKIQGGTLSGVKSRIRRGREKLSQRLGIEKEENVQQQRDAQPLQLMRARYAE